MLIGSQKVLSRRSSVVVARLTQSYRNEQYQKLRMRVSEFVIALEINQ